MKFERSFASYEGTTKTGKKKVDCWSDKNKIKSRDVMKGSEKKKFGSIAINAHMNLRQP